MLVLRAPLAVEFLELLAVAVEYVGVDAIVLA